MIEGWEEYTDKLNDKELEMAGLMALGFETKWGKDKAITSDEVIESMKAIGYKLSGARVRKIVNYLRLTRTVTNLVSSSKGYYRTNDPEDLARFVRSTEQRAKAIMAVAKSFDIEGNSQFKMGL